jgi:hypothetical protein
MRQKNRSEDPLRWWGRVGIPLRASFWLLFAGSPALTLISGLKRSDLKKSPWAPSRSSGTRRRDTGYKAGQKISALLIRAAIIGKAQPGDAQANFPERQFVGMRLAREQTGRQKCKTKYLSHWHS